MIFTAVRIPAVTPLALPQCLQPAYFQFFDGQGHCPRAQPSRLLAKSRAGSFRWPRFQSLLGKDPIQVKTQAFCYAPIDLLTNSMTCLEDYQVRHQSAKQLRWDGWQRACLQWSHECLLEPAQSSSTKSDLVITVMPCWTCSNLRISKCSRV